MKRRRVLVRPVRSFHCTAYPDRRRRTRDWRVVSSASIMLSDRHQGRSFPRSAKYHSRTSIRRVLVDLGGQASINFREDEKNENERSFLFWGLKLEGSCCLARPSSSCSPLQNSSKLEIFETFVAGRSAGPFVGRHFLLERHFAGEMISVGKARRCPFNLCKNSGGETEEVGNCEAEKEECLELDCVCFC